MDFCNIVQYMESMCNYDGGDCFGCNVGNISCNKNGGDCGRYEAGYPLFTGESVCSRSNYMTDKCDNNGRGDYDDKTR